LFPAAPHFLAKYPAMRIRKLTRSTFIFLLLVFLSLALVAPFVHSNTEPKKGRVTANPTKGNKYSVEQDVELGRQVAGEAEKQVKVLPANHPASIFVNKLGQKLAASAPGYKFPYTFKVVKDNGINAFALPGGPIYVNIGTIQAASEAELAGVMGHEISHVVMRHSTRQATRQMKAQVPLAILGGVLGATVGGWAGQLAQLGISVGAGGVFMKYSRDAETEADQVGAQIIYDSGYDPQAIVSFFQKLKAQTQASGGGAGPSFLASHPDPGDRAKNVSGILSRFPAKQYKTGDSAEYTAAKKALADVKVESPTQAQTPNVTPELKRLPASSLSVNQGQALDHSGFRLQYPTNWQVAGDQNSSVTIFPKGGASQGTVGYGFIVSGFQPSQGVNSLGDAMNELVASIRETNPDLKPVTGIFDSTVDRRPAKSIELQGKSAIVENGRPLPERVKLLAVSGKKGVVIYMVFVAPEVDFEMLRPVFDQVVRSFQVR